MSAVNSSHINSIQALRGFAALAVALLHLAGLQMLEGFRETTGLYRYGWIGVDVFFIISGFIMVWVTRNITASPKQRGDSWLSARYEFIPYGGFACPLSRYSSF